MNLELSPPHHTDSHCLSMNAPKHKIIFSSREGDEDGRMSLCYRGKEQDHTWGEPCRTLGPIDSHIVCLRKIKTLSGGRGGRRGESESKSSCWQTWRPGVRSKGHRRGRRGPTQASCPLTNAKTHWNMHSGTYTNK